MFNSSDSISLYEELNRKLINSTNELERIKLINDISLLKQYINGSIGKGDNEYVSNAVKKRRKENTNSISTIECLEMMRYVNYLKPKFYGFGLWQSRLSESDTIKLSKSFMSEYVSSDAMSKVNDIRFIKKIDVLGMCCYLLTERKHLILIKNTHHYNMFPTLVHELGHTVQTDNITDINEYSNILGSNLVEVTSCFYELLANDKLEYNDRIRARYHILNLVNSLAYEDYIDIGVDYTNLHSRLIAMYLYDMYQVKPNDALQIVHDINCLTKHYIDREILNKMHIDEENMCEGYRKYLSLYNREKR